MMRGRVRLADFFLGFAIVHASIAELVAEDLRHAEQLARVVLPQPPLEQQQVGGRVVASPRSGTLKLCLTSSWRWVALLVLAVLEYLANKVSL